MHKDRDSAARDRAPAGLALLFLVSLAADLLLAAPAARAAPDRAGIVGAARGPVTVTRAEDGGTQEAPARTEIYRNDVMATGPDAASQLLLVDETVFSIGENSEVRIDEYVYDPETGSGSIFAKYVKGTLRYVSGRIAAQGDDVQIQLPVGTVGIRGTDLFVGKDPATGEFIVGLNGPENGNLPRAHSGGFVFSGDGWSQAVTRAGYGLRISLDGKTFQVVKIDELLYDVISADLYAVPSKESGEGEEGEGVVSVYSFSGIGLDVAYSALDGSGAFDDPGEQQTEAADQDNQGEMMMSESGMDTLMDMMPDMPNNNFTVSTSALVELEWSEAEGPGGVTDLDLHLNGPSGGEGARFHVYFSDKGDFDAAPYAELAADIIDTSGLEKIAISEFQTGLDSGNYQISVFNYGDRANLDSTEFADNSELIEVRVLSGGTVSRGELGSFVIDGGDIVARANPPTTGTGNTWEVFEIDPDTLTGEALDRITSYANSSSVGSALDE